MPAGTGAPAAGVAVVPDAVARLARRATLPPLSAGAVHTVGEVIAQAPDIAPVGPAADAAAFGAAAAQPAREREGPAPLAARQTTPPPEPGAARTTAPRPVDQPGAADRPATAAPVADPTPGSTPGSAVAGRVPAVLAPPAVLPPRAAGPHVADRAVVHGVETAPRPPDAPDAPAAAGPQQPPVRAAAAVTRPAPAVAVTPDPPAVPPAAEILAPAPIRAPAAGPAGARTQDVPPAARPAPVPPVVIGQISIAVAPSTTAADPFAGCRALEGGLTARRGGGW